MVDHQSNFNYCDNIYQLGSYSFISVRHFSSQIKKLKVSQSINVFDKIFYNENLEF